MTAGEPGEPSPLCPPDDPDQEVTPAARARRRRPALVLLLTPLTLVLLVVVGQVVAWIDPVADSSTYEGNGVSFAYPARWREVEEIRSFPFEDRPEWRLGVGDEDHPYDVVIVSAYLLEGWVAANTLAAMKGGLTRSFRRVYEQLFRGSLLAGPEEITVGGMPGFQMRGRGYVDRLPVERMDVLVFAGSVEYQFECQYTPAAAATVEPACAQVLQTFTVLDPDAGSPVPTSAPSPTRTGPRPLTAAERRWLAALSAYRTEVDTEFFDDGIELTPETMRGYADLLRGCGRLAGRLPGPRLRPVHRLLLKACAPHDKAASCFATAARIGAPVAGTEQEGVFDRSIDCGFLGRAEGVEPLGDAIREGERIRLAAD